VSVVDVSKAHGENVQYVNHHASMSCSNTQSVFARQTGQMGIVRNGLGAPHARQDRAGRTTTISVTVFIRDTGLPGPELGLGLVTGA
jgi:hypothetical protein